MKLDHECVRDLLLAIESVETIYSFDLEPFHKEQVVLQKYSYKTLCHTAILLNDGNFLIAKDKQFYDGMVNVEIFRITPKGYEFLAKIKDLKKWKQILAKASKLGEISLPIIAQIAWDIVR